MRTMEKITFTNEQGQILSGRLERPEEDPIAYAIFAHCFACTKDVLATARISKRLTRSKIAVLRFDFTGLGDSAGQFSDTSFASNICDLVYAAKYLRENFQAPLLLIGHSWGGAAVIPAAKLIPEVRAIATIGAPSDPAHVSHLFDNHIEQIKAHGAAVVEIAGRRIEISKKLIDDMHQHDLLGILNHLNKAYIIFHSPLDDVVGIEHAVELYKAAKHPKSFISIDKADHLLTKENDTTFVADILGTWAKRYIT